MAEMMTAGFRALDKSAQIAVGEDEKITFKECHYCYCGRRGGGGSFVALPLWLSDRAAAAWELSAAGKNVIEGCLRGAVFVAYVARNRIVE